jgi:6-phosphogluconolactonase/glucosamine-6-phosphate isomerase/deaminase
MKHLKPFNENYDYQLISREEWHKYNSDERIVFNKREIETVERFIQENHMGEVTIEWNEERTQLTLSPNYAHIDWTYVEKYDDEWYLVWISREKNEYYKCDQLEGLIDLIGQIII